MNNVNKTYFFLSILLNVLLIGIFLGRFSGDWGRQRRKPPPPAFSKQLPVEKEKLMRETMRKVHGQHKGLEQKMNSARADVFQVLTAPQFDAKTYREKVKALHDLHGMQMEQMAQATETLALEFSQEERGYLAEHLKRKSQTHRPGTDHRRPHHPPSPPRGPFRDHDGPHGEEYRGPPPHE
jgi:uncharacterized membrane protein